MESTILHGAEPGHKTFTEDQVSLGSLLNNWQPSAYTADLNQTHQDKPLVGTKLPVLSLAKEYLHDVTSVVENQAHKLAALPKKLESEAVHTLAGLPKFLEHEAHKLAALPKVLENEAHKLVTLPEKWLPKEVPSLSSLVPHLTARQAWQEVGKLVGIHNAADDRAADIRGVAETLGHPELEANISERTAKALMKDADLYPPQKNADGSTTYKIVQIGLTDRALDPSEGTGARYYSRGVEITVPAGAKNLGTCQFDFSERHEIDEKSFQSLINRERDRNKVLSGSDSASGATAVADNVTLHSHGVYTYGRSADTQALLLELTNGRPTVNIDWEAHPNAEPTQTLTNFLHYSEDIISAKTANKVLESSIDKTIAAVGADHTTMIGYSHGGKFDSRYLRHRVDQHLPKLDTVVLAHPDLQAAAKELRVSNDTGLFGAAASRAFVIGGVHDSQLQTASYVPQSSGVRLGINTPAVRKQVELDGAIPITEFDRKDPKSSQHLLNFAGISELLNGSRQRSAEQLQQAFTAATEVARKR